RARLRHAHAQPGRRLFHHPRPTLQPLDPRDQIRAVRFRDGARRPNTIQFPQRLQRPTLPRHDQRQTRQQRRERERDPDRAIAPHQARSRSARSTRPATRCPARAAIRPPSARPAVARSATWGSLPAPPDSLSPPGASGPRQVRDLDNGTPVAPEDTRTPCSTRGTPPSPHGLPPNGTPAPRTLPMAPASPAAPAAPAAPSPAARPRGSPRSAAPGRSEPCPSPRSGQATASSPQPDPRSSQSAAPPAAAPPPTPDAAPAARRHRTGTAPPA